MSVIVTEARALAGMTQSELARSARTAQPSVARIESGAVSPTLETLERLVRAAGFQLRWQLAPLPSADPVIETYKVHVDRSLLRDNLRKTAEDRVRALHALSRFAAAAKTAPRTKRKVVR